MRSLFSMIGTITAAGENPISTLLITGANRGLGLEFARRYLAQGWRVIVFARQMSKALDELGTEGDLQVRLGQFSDPPELERLAASCRDERIDLLINNAGIMGTDTFRLEKIKKQGLRDFSREEWRDVFEINLFTPVHLISLLLPVLAPGARIVTISSSMGSIEGNHFGGWFAYRASKAAVNSLMRSVALELAEDGMIAIALHPGWVRTEMGGPDADIDAKTSIEGMMKVIEALETGDNGQYIGFDGERLRY